jgi:hypothetical protein
MEHEFPPSQNPLPSLYPVKGPDRRPYLTILLDTVLSTAKRGHAGNSTVNCHVYHDSRDVYLRSSRRASSRAFAIPGGKPDENVLHIHAGCNLPISLDSERQ